MAAAQTSGTELDSRPLPPGWVQGYDEENQKCCYFYYDATSSPSISYVHPLDIGTGANNLPATITGTTRASRPLPKVPGASPSQTQHPMNGAPDPPPSLQPPPAASPSPTPRVPSAIHNPPQVMLSPAQQLYASSFANKGVSISSLPAPSLRPESPSSQLEGATQQSLYQGSVAAHISPVVPSDPCAKSPASTVSSSRSPTLSPSQPAFSPAPSTPRSAQGFEPQSPPYSEFSLPDDDDASITYRGLYIRDPPNGASYPRGRSESDGYFRTREAPNRAYRSEAGSKSLFPLKYIDHSGAKPLEVRNVSTTAKPPTGVAGTKHITPAFQNLAPIDSSLPPYSPSLVGKPSSPSTANATPVALSVPTHHPAGARASTTNLPMPTAQLVPPVRPSPHPAPPQPPPPLPSTQQSHQTLGVPISMPAHVQTHPQPIPPRMQRPPQSQQHQPQRPPINPGNPQPPTSAKPNKPSNPMGNLGSTFANALGRTAIELGTSAILSSLGVEQEEEEEGGGIADALVSGLTGLAVGGEGGGEEPPATTEAVPPSTQYAPPVEPAVGYSNPEYFAQAPPPPPPQPISATVSTSGGDYQPSFLNGLQYTSFNFELPSTEFHSNGSSGNTQGGGGQANNWNQGQVSAPSNTYGGGSGPSYHPPASNLPVGAQQPYRPQQVFYPGHQHQPQSPSWNPYQFR